MKKITAMLLVLVMALSLAACNTTPNNPETTTEPTVAGPASALEVLQNIWGLYTDENKFFAMGGDFNAPVDGAPGAVDLTNADFLTYNLLVPAAEQANVTEAASLIHGMNANSFTCGAYKVADPAAFATAMQTAIQGNMWMCGFPETLVVASFGGGYVLVAFGVNDAMTPFLTNLQTAYPAAELLVNEPIAG